MAEAAGAGCLLETTGAVANGELEMMMTGWLAGTAANGWSPGSAVGC